MTREIFAYSLLAILAVFVVIVLFRAKRSSRRERDRIWGKKRRK